MASDSSTIHPAILRWTIPGRVLVFVLAATSIWCLLAEMYGLLGMRAFFFAILAPATLALYAIAVRDRTRGDRRMWRAVIIGTLAGLAGAAAYDIFRLPFVFASAWGLDAFGVPQMNLFKVFPRFGAMILGQPLEQATYSLSAHLVGWAYHFSNGATFGVMFAALACSANEQFSSAPRKGLRWPYVAWAALMAAGIELCLLISPYASFFQIRLDATFIAVTLTAHLIFGVGMGLWFAWQTGRWRMDHCPIAAA